MPNWWKIIKALFSEEPLEKEPCVEANAIIGSLSIVSLIMAFAIEGLRGKASTISVSHLVASVAVSLILLSAWYVRTFSDKDPGIILVLHGVMCILAVGYFLYHFSGIGDWWQAAEGNKRVSISPGIITIGLVYGVRLVGDFSYMEYNRIAVVWTAAVLGLMGDIYMMTVFLRLRIPA